MLVKPEDFVHLHLHTNYSILDSMISLDGLCNRLDELGMKTTAVTEHGNMFSAVFFYKQAKKRGIKPILGLEAYIAPESRLNHSVKSEYKEGLIIPKYYHLVLLVKNEVGYKNLIKLTSKSYTEGFYYRPRIDKDLLYEHHEGLICLSACLAGEIPKLLLANKINEARAVMKEYKIVFGDDYYFEIMRHGINEQEIVIERGVKLARELDVPIVATNDCHYLAKKDVELHNIILNVQNKAGTAMREYETGEFYVKSGQEMMELFKDIPEACENTKKIADQCQYDFKFGNYHFPKLDIPEGLSEDEYLADLSWKGFAKRYPNEKKSGKIGQRLQYELDVIKNMGFPGYFLVVADFTVYAKDVLDIEVGCARGSAGGSVVAFCLRITEIDPMKYGLMFERFLNPERISMPDIDMDFSKSRRLEVIDYVTKKYGADCVSQITTIGYMLAKTAIRDVARVLKVPIHKADKMAKSIVFNMSLKEIYTESEDDEKAIVEAKKEIISILEEDEETRNVCRLALGIEGTPRQTGVHAAGVVISDKPLSEYLPLMEARGTVATQYTMDILEPLGLLKMDFLGLRTLDVLRNAVEFIKKRHGIWVDIHNLPMDDVKTCQMLSDGYTKGVFQSDSSGICKLIKNIAPTSMFDCVPIVALYRPGPLESGMVDTYLACRHGRELAEPFYPTIADITKDTYHQFLYQEQIMQTSQVLCGFSIGEADKLRKAIGKKNAKMLAELRKKFVEGAVKTNPNDPKVAAIADDLYSKIEFFGRYCFNKAHSAAYGLIMYQTAYLKANYPVEYMCALLESMVGENEDTFIAYLREAKRMGLRVLPPCVNKSEATFSVESDTEIRYGLNGIKGLSAGAARIFEARENGKFETFFDFLERVKLHSGNLKALTMAGAFDCFNFTRRTLYNKIDSKIMDKVAKVLKEKAIGQIDMFEDEGVDYQYGKMVNIDEFSEKELLAEEKRLLGVYLGKHPIDRFKEFVQHVGEFRTVTECHECKEGQAVTLAVVVSNIKTIATKKGDAMAFLDLEDNTGTISATVFPKTFVNYQNSIALDNVILVEAYIQLDDFDDDGSTVKNKTAQLIIISAFNLEKMLRTKKKYKPTAEFMLQKKRSRYKIKKSRRQKQISHDKKIVEKKIPTGLRIFVKTSFAKTLAEYVKHYGRPGASKLQICIGDSGSGGVVVELPTKYDLKSLESVFKVGQVGCELRYD